MLRLFLALTVLFLLSAQAAQSQAGALRQLNSGIDGRAWEGVGRLDVDGSGFCTGALIADNLVLTAAHCLFDPRTRQQIDPARFEFLAGWRNGRASAYRWVSRAVVHPEYEYDGNVAPERVRFDVALLELHHPIRNTTVMPFETDARPHKGDEVGVVSYAHDRSEAPSLQEVCGVLARQEGVLVMSCEVDFGASGAPIFSFKDGHARIVSVVSAKAEVNGTKVALGTQLEEPVNVLRAELAAGRGVFQGPAPRVNRIMVGTGKRAGGAKFIKP